MKRYYKYIKQFFQDDDNMMSMTRLLAFLLVTGGLVYIYIYPLHYLPGIECIVLGLGAKVTQKKLSETFKKKKDEKERSASEGQQD